MYKYILLIILFAGSALKGQIINPDTIRVTLPVDTLDTDTLTLYDSLTLSDTLGILSDSSIIAVPDTLKPLYQTAFYGYSTFINKKEFYRRAYYYTGDIFELTPFAFNASHGFPGHPDNLLLNGTGSSLTSYLVNGINYNDYSQIPLDLNRISTEYIDSAEVVPLPRSFVYSINNNVSTVNFIGKDFLSITPYSRIRYYEGPFEEGFFDGIFNSVLLNKFNFYIQITNRKADDRYENTDYSNWNGRIQLKYLLSNKLNFITGYEYTSTRTGASGGVDVKNVPPSSVSFLETIYDEITTPVIYNDLRFNTFSEQVYLKTLADFGKFASTDFSIYYRFNRTELNGNPNDSLYLDDLFKNKITGAALNQDFRISIFNLNLLANLEYADLTGYTGFRGASVIKESKVTNMSLGGVFSANFLDSLFNPSVFYKINREKYIDFNNYSGFGVDFVINLPSWTSLYAGYSEFQNRLINGYSKNLQVGVRYSRYNFNTGVSYFSRKALINATGYPDSILNVNSSYYYPGTIEGINFNFDVLVYKFLLEGKADYYREQKNDLTSIIPPIVFTGGFFFKDSLFSGNLDLKAGVNFYYYGKRNLNLDPEYFDYYEGNTSGPDFRFDLLISGEIQGLATVFFTWENVLNEKYFFIPFYPMPPLGIRFGLSWEIFN